MVKQFIFIVFKDNINFEASVFPLNKSVRFRYFSFLDIDYLIVGLFATILACFVHFCIYFYGSCRKELSTCGHIFALIASGFTGKFSMIITLIHNEYPVYHIANKSVCISSVLSEWIMLY